jgi:hypothetical protein
MWFSSGGWMVGREKREGVNKVFRSRGGFQCGHGKNNRGKDSFAFRVADYYNIAQNLAGSSFL